MSFHAHTFAGCSPAPLAGYLKALGILRLVGEQADPQARGWWDGERFLLLTVLSREELEAFFLERYEPTPLVSPWNKGSGFFNAEDPARKALEKSSADRFRKLREEIAASWDLTGEIRQADGVIRSIKARTKRGKGFQTKEQRRLLGESHTFCACLAELRKEVETATAEERAELEECISAVESLVEDLSSPHL